jgi:hypothetical protein
LQVDVARHEDLTETRSVNSSVADGLAAHPKPFLPPPEQIRARGGSSTLVEPKPASSV